MNALSNLKILDFTTLLPGPFATMQMADMGADVIKISSPSKYDLVLEAEPKINGKSANLLWLNRNKKTLALNLKTKEAVDIVKELVKEYDIIVEQFRPGVMEKLGLGYEELSKINPRLIYCSITGYGQTGPMANKAGHDINFLAKSGVLGFSGRNESGPELYGTQIADIAGGTMNSIIGILAAVNYRHFSGEGQYIDISMMDGALPLNSLPGAGYLAGGELPKREGDLLNGGSNYDFYETKDGRYFAVGSLEPKFWSVLCDTLEIDGKTSTDLSVKDEIKEKFLEKDFDEWVEIFKDKDACVEPVLNLDEVVEDEHIKERGLIVELDVDGEKIKQFASPIAFSKTKQEYKFAGKKIGEDTEEILKSLGYSEDKIKELKDLDVFK
ncbi:CaiB/BaiF CoA transferase family protein [Peptoniphilus sp.]|jgi:alpha-methylacyl-CoA racemase|uniref:CaiB/BaiF CoA transferase family protein n=1 Tax=Peptoniphilus sp. TaxID=1971214 RepID=UPI003D92B64B